MRGVRAGVHRHRSCPPGTPSHRGHTSLFALLPTPELGPRPRAACSPLTDHTPLARLEPRTAVGLSPHRAQPPCSPARRCPRSQAWARTLPRPPRGRGHLPTAAPSQESPTAHPPPLLSFRCPEGWVEGDEPVPRRQIQRGKRVGSPWGLGSPHQGTSSLSTAGTAHPPQPSPLPPRAAPSPGCPCPPGTCWAAPCEDRVPRVPCAICAKFWAGELRPRDVPTWLQDPPGWASLSWPG